LSNGRLTLGVGLGGDQFAGEFSRSGDEVNDRVRAEQLDECLDILTAGWSGETVDHRGKHYLVDGVRFEPRPVAGRIPIWCAGFPGNVKPIRRAARYDGFFPVNLTSPDQVASGVAIVEEERGSLDGFDVVIALESGTDVQPYTDAGATWCLTDWDPAVLRLADVQSVVTEGPPR
jgi:alkanesulfonate monooxygenase SsuD/methylene tetrahydromethanopterin reductase-like flavin-dependent oxidoreductase (luciferase family)